MYSKIISINLIVSFCKQCMYLSMLIHDHDLLFYTIGVALGGYKRSPNYSEALLVEINLVASRWFNSS